MSGLSRRKLTNGVHSNGSVANGHDQGLGPDLVLKVNFEKCLVDLRNQTLAQYASDHIGEVTGQVYHTLLRLLSDKIARCRMDPRFDLEPVHKWP
ncbi:DNA-directed RNA polymerase III subunit RPC3 like protein [Verticillium longisporum]|nr:DNA-directed RNA polymerase III subunit RPC3 like protein [Verticillium longisporum]